MLDGAEPIRIIRTAGDVLEREMFANEAFAAWFGGYAGLWSRYILPQRGQDGLVTDPRWREFAARNYTAIVRCWNAWAIKERLVGLPITRASRTDILDIHEQFATFLAMARCALDNLHQGLTSRTGKCELGGRLINAYGKDLPDLGWIRQIRNELVHDRLLPLRVQSGRVQLDRSLLPVGQEKQACKKVGNQQPSSTPWHEGTGDWVDLRDLIESIWDRFPNQINALWIAIEGELGTPSVASSASETGLGDAWASGLPANQDPSRDMFGPAGGSAGSA